MNEWAVAQGDRQAFRLKVYTLFPFWSPVTARKLLLHISSASTKTQGSDGPTAPVEFSETSNERRQTATRQLIHHAVSSRSPETPRGISPADMFSCWPR